MLREGIVVRTRDGPEKQVSSLPYLVLITPSLRVCMFDGAEKIGSPFEIAVTPNRQLQQKNCWERGKKITTHHYKNRCCPSFTNAHNLTTVTNTRISCFKSKLLATYNLSFFPIAGLTEKSRLSDSLFIINNCFWMIDVKAYALSKRSPVPGSWRWILDLVWSSSCCRVGVVKSARSRTWVGSALYRLAFRQSRWWSVWSVRLAEGYAAHCRLANTLWLWKGLTLSPLN